MAFLKCFACTGGSYRHQRTTACRSANNQTNDQQTDQPAKINITRRLFFPTTPTITTTLSSSSSSSSIITSENVTNEPLAKPDSLVDTLDLSTLSVDDAKTIMQILKIFTESQYATGVDEQIIRSFNTYLVAKTWLAPKDFFSLLLKISPDAELATLIAFCYQYGFGTARNNDFAFSYYKIANTPFAQNQIGWMYQHGVMVEESEDKAIEWYEKSAAGMNPHGLSNLAHHLRPKDGTSRRVFDLYLKSTYVGYQNGYLRVGRAYQEGFGTNKDVHEFYRWQLRHRKQKRILEAQMRANLS